MTLTIMSSEGPYAIGRPVENRICSFIRAFYGPQLSNKCNDAVLRIAVIALVKAPFPVREPFVERFDGIHAAGDWTVH